MRIAIKGLLTLTILAGLSWIVSQGPKSKNVTIREKPQLTESERIESNMSALVVFVTAFTFIYSLIDGIHDSV